jgi:hypothetical protein
MLREVTPSYAKIREQHGELRTNSPLEAPTRPFAYLSANINRATPERPLCAKAEATQALSLTESKGRALEVRNPSQNRPILGQLPAHATFLPDSNLNISRIVPALVAFWTDSTC